ncbi:hypothetical protein GOP47_0030986, partial [Adiantum capillus-veneris]
MSQRMQDNAWILMTCKEEQHAARGKPTKESRKCHHFIRYDRILGIYKVEKDKVSLTHFFGLEQFKEYTDKLDDLEEHGSLNISAISRR